MDVKNDQITKLGMKDVARDGMIALPLIMLFEALLMVSWTFNVDDKTSIGAIGYFVGYVLLFLASAFVVIFIQLAKKNIDKNYKSINVVNNAYALAIVVWVVAFTYVGSEFRNSFDCLVYVTIIAIVPLFCYLNNWYWFIIQVISASCMYYIGSHHDHYTSFVINFTVFTIISMAAGYSIHRIRHNSYLRQLELERERNNAWDLAHKDTLTGLKNRFSFMQELEALKSKASIGDLIFMMLDVNGLKEVNDALGHEAGDELLQGTALCMSKAFSYLGTIYRIGGDEFAGILYAREDNVKDAISQFEILTSSWKGKKAKNLSVALGYAVYDADCKESLSELMTKADNAMYASKKLHYQNISKH